MPYEIEVHGVGIVEVPDNIPPEEAGRMLRKQFPPSDADIYNTASSNPKFALDLTVGQYEQYRRHKASLPTNRLDNFVTGLATLGGEVASGLWENPLKVIGSLHRAGYVGTGDLWGLAQDIAHIEADDTYAGYLKKKGLSDTGHSKFKYHQELGKDLDEFKRTMRWAGEREEVIAGAWSPDAARGFANITDPTLLIPGFGLAGKAGTVAEKAALRGVAKAGAMGEGVGARVSAAAAIPENMAARLAAAATDSVAAGEAARNAVARGATIGLGAGLGGISIPGATTAATVVAGGKAAGATMSALGEATRVASGHAMHGTGMLSPLEALAADAAASTGARAIGRVGAALGLDTAGQLAWSAGRGAAEGTIIGGVLGGLAHGFDSSEMYQGMGGGFALGGVGGGIGRGVAKISGAEYAGNVHEDFKRFTADRSDAAHWATFAEGQSSKWVANQLGITRILEGAGWRVVLHDKTGAVSIRDPRLGGATDYAAVAVKGKTLPDGTTLPNTVYVNADSAIAKKNGVAHEAFHAIRHEGVLREIDNLVNGERAGGVVIREGALTGTAFTDFAKSYVKALPEGSAKRAELERALLRMEDPSLSPTDRFNAKKNFLDEFGAYYMQAWTGAQKKDAFLAGRIDTVYSKLFNIAYDKIANRLGLNAQRHGFNFSGDDILGGFHVNGKRIAIPALDKLIAGVVKPKNGQFEPVVTKVVIGKDLVANRGLIKAMDLENQYVWDASDNPLRLKTPEEIKADERQFNAQLMHAMEAVPAAVRGGVRAVSTDRGSIGADEWTLTQRDPVSEEQIVAIKNSGVYSPAQRARIETLLRGISSGDIFHVGYWKAMENGLAGVYPHTMREVLPYSVHINSAKGLYFKFLDVSRVRANFTKAMAKPENRGLYVDHGEAWTSFVDTYLKNLSNETAVPSAEALGGGDRGQKRRNLFYEVLGTVPKKGQTLINLAAEDYVPSRKGGSVVESFRPERITSLDVTGDKMTFNEALTYPRSQVNFLPAFGDVETVGTAKVRTHEDGSRIIKQLTGGYRLYKKNGELAGVFDSWDAAQEAYAKGRRAEAAKESSVRFMAGYADDFSKSNNAIDAEANGRFPASVISKKLGIPVAFLKENFHTSEWHHTGTYYNHTAYYDLAAVKEWLAGTGDYEVRGTESSGSDKLAEWRMKQKEAKEAGGDVLSGVEIKYLEWSGTKNHPHATEIALQNVTIVRKPGQKMVTITSADGKTFRKALDTRGFQISSKRDGKFSYADHVFNQESSKDNSAKFLPDDQPAYYSRIERTVEQSDQGKAKGAQWKALIKNSKLGVSPDEADYVGVKNLDDSTTYTKREVMEYLKANEVKVDEVVLGGERATITPDFKLFYFDDSDEYKTDYGWSIPYKTGDDYGYYTIRERTEKEGGQFYTIQVPHRSGSGDEYLADHETLEEAKESILGDDDIRQTLFDWELAANRHEALPPDTHFAKYQLPGADEGSYREVFLTSPGRNAKGGTRAQQQGWSDGHSAYSEIKNPIVRIRHNIRSNAAGEKTFFIEEVQPPVKDNFKEMPELFQKKWKEMAMKWAVRRAAEDGLDAVGWTTGHTQADRYNLSQHIDALNYLKNEDGTYQILTIKAGQSRSVEHGIAGDRLEGLVGKELAKKITDGEGAKGANGVKKLTGLDLQVGGEGLRDLYDNVLRSVVNGLPAVKKAGQRVGGAEIPQKHDASHNYRFESIDRARRVFDGGGEIYGVDRGNHETLIKQRDEITPNNFILYVLGDKQPGASIHSLTITPEMRASIMSGQARFLPDAPGGREVNRDAILKQHLRDVPSSLAMRLAGSGRIFSPEAREGLLEKQRGGEFNQGAHNRVVERDIPVREVDLPTAETLPTHDQIRDALPEGGSQGRVGMLHEIPAGTAVTLRQDVPSWERGVGTVRVVGDVDGRNISSYEAAVRILNPQMMPSAAMQRTAEKIGAGAAKKPTITIEGVLHEDQSLPADLSEWTQVGFNPDRHSYYYDRSDRGGITPVIGGSEAVQVGNTVFVKDPIFGKQSDFRYLPEDGNQRSYQTGARTEEAKNGSIRLYGKEGKLLGVFDTITSAEKRLDRVSDAVKFLPEDPYKEFLEILNRSVGDQKKNVQTHLGRGPQTGVSKNKLTVFTDKNGSNTISVGATKDAGGKPFDIWTKENEQWLSAAEIKSFRNWYNELPVEFGKVFHKDPERFMVAWLAAQQNTSPAQAMGVLFRAIDRAQDIRSAKTSGSGQAKLQRGGLADEKVEAMVRGVSPEGGYGGKLADFADAGMGRRTRTFMGDDPRTGQPFVADVHTGRDSGFVDQQTLTRLVAKGSDGSLFLNGKPVSLEVSKYKFSTDAHGKKIKQPERVMVRQEGEKSFSLFVDMRGSPSGSMYEGVSVWGNRLTEYLNETQWQGGGWTPAEAQAVGWMRVLRQYGLQEGSISSAVSENTRVLYNEIGYDSGSLLPQIFSKFSGLPHHTQAAITKTVMERVAVDLTKLIGGSLGNVELTLGSGLFGGTESPSMMIRATGSKEVTDMLSHALAYVGEQAMIIAVTNGLGGKSSQGVYVKKTGGGTFTAAERTSLTKVPGVSGFSIFPMNGNDTIFITGSGENYAPKGFTEKQANALGASISAWSTSTGIKVDIKGAPCQIVSHGNDYKAQPAGDRYLDLFVKSGGHRRVRELIQYRGESYINILTEAFAQHAPQLKVNPPDPALQQAIVTGERGALQREALDRGLVRSALAAEPNLPAGALEQYNPDTTPHWRDLPQRP